MMPTRDRTGRFTLSDSTIQYKAAAERMKACLEREAEAIERAQGKVWHGKKFRALPEPKKHPTPVVIPFRTADSQTVLDLEAA